MQEEEEAASVAAEESQPYPSKDTLKMSCEGRAHQPSSDFIRSMLCSQDKDVNRTGKVGGQVKHR